MKKFVSLTIMSSFLLVGCTAPTWFEMFDEVTYDDLEVRPVSFYLNGEEFYSEKNPAEQRPSLAYPMGQHCYVHLVEGEDSLFSMYYPRENFNDGEGISNVGISLTFVWYAPELTIGVKYHLPEPSPTIAYPRISYQETAGDNRVFEAKDGWVEFSQIDTVNNIISGSFAFIAEDMYNSGDTVNVTDGVFENIPLIYK